MTKDEKQIIKLEKVDDKTAYENLLVKYAELESKIADIKANCDLAIEGRDIKIKELEQKLEQTEKDLADYQFNYPKIKELEKENAELKEKVRTYESGYAYEKMYELRVQAQDRLTKAKEIIRDLLGCFFYLFEHDNKTRGHININNAIEQAEQFIREIEK